MVMRLLDNRTCCVQSVFTYLELWRKLLFIASLNSQQICTIDVYVDLQPFSCNLKGGLFEPQLGGTGTW